MIRPVTCVCMLLAGASGLYLYQTKHRTRLLDLQIEQTVKETETARERAGILRAELALLSEPERLSDLAGRHLALKPVSPAQFVNLAELDRRLPAPAPATPPGSTDEAVPEPMAAAAEPSVQLTATAAGAAPGAVTAQAAAPARPPAPAVRRVQVARREPRPERIERVERPERIERFERREAMAPAAYARPVAAQYSHAGYGGTAMARIPPGVPAMVSSLGAAGPIMAAPVPVSDSGPR